MSRPRMSRQKRLSCVVSFAVIPEVYEALCAKADEQQKPLSEYLRKKLLDKEFEEHFDKMFGILPPSA